VTVVALASGCGSPGVSALSVGLGFTSRSLSYEQPLLIEADPAGGSLALRFGLPASPSLASLAGDIGRTYTPGMIESHAVDLRGVRCVAAPADPLVVKWSLQRATGPLTTVLPSLPSPVVIDLGRIMPEAITLELARAVDVLALVVRPSLEDIQRTLFTVRTVRSVGCSPGVIVVGEQPHHPMEIAEVLGCPLIGVIPSDPVMARAFVGGRFRPRALTRSVLWRSMEAISAALFTQPAGGSAGAVAPTATNPAPPPPEVPGPPVSTKVSQEPSEDESDGRSRSSPAGVGHRPPTGEV
jgi:MinD-like ATPase involved in chromosome partitioning or flagellar assembly